MLVEDEYGRVELACDGYIGRGYWTRHLRVVQEALDLFVTVPVTRAVLADPERALTNLGGAASGTSEQARTALLAAWAHPREH